jgi:hypothetical protein
MEEGPTLRHDPLRPGKARQDPGTEIVSRDRGGICCRNHLTTVSDSRSGSRHFRTVRWSGLICRAISAFGTPALRASPRHTVWLMLKGTASAKRYLEELYRASPVVSTLAQVGREFFRIIRNRDLAALPEWLTGAKKTALVGFANRLARDQQAIEAALKLPWSQGHVEGQIHRLKLIKRQMYGRAGFDLLRLRVLHAA